MTDPRERRAYGLYGVGSRFGVMVVIALVVADLVWVGFIATSFWPFNGGSNPIDRAGQHIVDFLHPVKPEDAWAFLGVFAAIVVAIQVAASANQQSRGSIADDRASRFTVAALMTGAGSLLAGICFAIAFGAHYPSRLVLILVADLGIAFFAADGASIVLRQDRRHELKQAIREQSRTPEALAYRSGNPWATLARNVTVLALWPAVIALLSLAAVGAVAAANGGSITSMNWWPVFLSLILLALTMAGLGIAVTAAVWASNGSTTGLKVSWVALAGALFAVACWAVGNIVAAGLRDELPWWATVCVALAVALPFVGPSFALTRMRWPAWTSAGSLVQARSAVARLRLASNLRSLARLNRIFSTPS